MHRYFRNSVIGLTVAVCCSVARGAVAQGATAPSAANGLTLVVCRDLALSRNAEFAAAGLDVSAARAAQSQAGSLPNPELSIEIEDFGRTLPDWSESQTTYLLSQRISPFAPRGARLEAARQGVLAAEAEFDRARRRLIAEIDRRFAALQAAQERGLVAHENSATADTLLRTVSSLVEAGEASPIEVDRARADLSLARVAETIADADIKRARGELATLWHGEGRDSLVAAGLLTPPSIPDRGRILQTPVRSLERARWDAEVGMRLALAKQEHRSRLPALVLGAGARRYAATGDHAFTASVTLEAPLLDRRDAAVREANLRAEQARVTRASVDALEAAQRSAGYEIYAARAQEARTLVEVVLPDLARAHAAILEGYGLGKFRLLDVLDSRRILADARTRSIDALEAAAAARADLEMLLGTTLEELEDEAR